MNKTSLEFECADDTNDRKCVYPIGPWRFLTSLDKLEPNDLIRVVCLRKSERTPYDMNWSLARHSDFQGAYMSDIARPGREPVLEAIRPIDETATYIRIFANGDSE